MKKLTADDPETTYRVEFDNEKLVESCIRALREAPPIPKTRLQWRKADVAIGKAGGEATEREGAATVVIDEADIELPDVLTELQDRTQLTRRTIHRVLTGSRRLDDFKRNPQAFIELAGEAINRRKRLAVVDGIKYQRLGDEHYYAQELFEQKELTGYLKNMLEKTRKSVYASVVYDSDIEATFADGLEKNEAIKVYAKLPGWFQVADAARHVQPGLGGAGRARRGRAPLPGGRDQERPVRRRPPRRGAREDRVREEALQGAGDP